jgi:hypothetical protein
MLLRYTKLRRTRVPSWLATTVRASEQSHRSASSIFGQARVLPFWYGRYVELVRPSRIRRDFQEEANTTCHIHSAYPPGRHDSYTCVLNRNERDPFYCARQPSLHANMLSTVQSPQRYPYISVMIYPVFGAIADVPQSSVTGEALMQVSQAESSLPDRIFHFQARLGEQCPISRHQAHRCDSFIVISSYFVDTGI